MKMLDTPFITGEKVYLRPLKKKDLTSRYLGWLNDYDVTKNIVTGKFPYHKESLDEFYETMRKSERDVMFAIIDKKSGIHIGNARVGPINWVHRNAEYGIIIGEKRYWGKGYGTEVTKLVLNYAFNRLCLNKIILGVVADHASAVRAYAKAGFRTEGRLKDFLYIDGRYCDRVIMGITKNEYSRLSRNRGLSNG